MMGQQPRTDSLFYCREKTGGFIAAWVMNATCN